MCNTDNSAGRTEIVVGGQRYVGKDDYLKTINGIFNRLNSINSNVTYKEILWDLDYCTNLLINSIIDSKERAKMRQAKQAIIAIELLKKVKNPTKFASIEELKDKLTPDEINLACIDACLQVVGEMRSYTDRYWGLETKLGVMIGEDVDSNTAVSILVDEEEEGDDLVD